LFAQGLNAIKDLGETTNKSHVISSGTEKKNPISICQIETPQTQT